MSDAPILVIGAAGKTGRHITARLRTSGAPHQAAVHRPGSGGGSPEVHFDWTDESTWHGALATATRAYVVKPPPWIDAGVTMERLLECAHSLERVVLLSEMLRDEKPADEPNRAAELAVLAAIREPVILRPNWFLQNWSREGGFYPSVRNDRALVLPVGDAGASLIDVRDVADVAVRLLTVSHPDLQAVDLTGAEIISMPEFAQAIGIASGRPVRYLSPTLDEARADLDAQGVNARHRAYLMDLYADFADGRFSRISNGVMQVLDRPPTTIAAFAQDHAADW